MTKQEWRQRQRQRRLNRCVHDTGPWDGECAVGVRYADMQDTSQLPVRYICTSPESTVSCAKRQLPTLAEVEEKECDQRKRMERMILVSDMIDRTGQQSGTIDCLFCDGKLHFSVASNGHRAVRCTNRCVLWIE